MIIAITGGRDRTPTLSELEQLAAILQVCTAVARVKALFAGVEPAPVILREGEARGTDKAVAAWVRARKLAKVEPWPAAWRPVPGGPVDRGAGPKRNRAMLDGRATVDPKPPAELLVAFEGGVGTADCVKAAGDRRIRVEAIEPAQEPRPWNRHHGDPPGRAVYVGRGTPLGNPFKLELQHGEARLEAGPRVLLDYKRWLWSRISRSRSSYDPEVAQALGALEPSDYLVCSCWPAHCHAEVIVAAWRWSRNSKSVQR